tara:strand:+ start:79 stop:288 length:210 start_codon:yes stop_codon:yes gene_type:complete
MVVNAKADVANITERLVADAIAMQSIALAIPNIPDNAPQKPYLIEFEIDKTTPGPGLAIVAAAIVMYKR